MAYDSIDYDSIDYDERNADHAALSGAASKNGVARHADAADLSVDEKERDAAQWSDEWGEGAPACLAAVVYAQRTQRRLHAQAHEGRAGGEVDGEAEGDNPSVGR